jgi:hypothetical protein
MLSGEPAAAEYQHQWHKRGRGNATSSKRPMAARLTAVVLLTPSTLVFLISSAI